MKKSNKGITLIALIITIIVLLILAGVAISTLAGENGVINRAQKAVSKNKQAVALEEVSLAWTELLSDWHETWSAQGVSFESCVTAANLNEYMKDSAKIDSVTNNGDGTYTIVYKANDNEGNIYTFKANENGKIELSNGIIISPSKLTLELVRKGEMVTKTPKTIRANLTNVDGELTWTVTSGAGVVSLSNTTGTAIKSQNSSNAEVSVGTSTTYRLFYIDVGGNYETEGTIYLKADADTNYGSLDDLDALPSGKTSVIKSSLNKTWINSPSANYSDRVMAVLGSNSYVSNNKYSGNYAFCPLVSCNSGVNINQKR